MFTSLSPLCLHLIPVEMKSCAWAGRALGPYFGKSLVSIMGEQYSRDLEGTGSQILMEVFPKSSMGKSKLGNRVL